MANEFYSHASWPPAGSFGSSADARAEMELIEAGFDKLAPLSGNQYKVLYIKVGGTGYSSIGGNGLLKLSTTGAPSIATPDTDYATPTLVSTTMSDHLAAADPHPQYQTEAEAVAFVAAAAASEAAAAASAAAAAASAAAASASAAAAATSETNAATSETNAATSEANAAASYDSFDDRYLGAKAADPTLDNDGDALLTGALYWNTTVGALKFYDGAAWQAYGNAVLKAGDTMTGSLTFSSGNIVLSGAAQRIIGDFTATPISNRSLFQTSAANTSTVVGAIPSGTGTIARFTAFNSSDPNNSSEMSIGMTDTAMQIISTLRGTGSYLPIQWQTGGATRMTMGIEGRLGLGVAPNAGWESPPSVIPTSMDIGPTGAVWAGSAGIGVTANAYYNGTSWVYKSNNPAIDLSFGTALLIRFAPSGVAENPFTYATAFQFSPATGESEFKAGKFGYGTGAGGTVTQLTSKSTAITLNKPSGQFTTNNASLAGGGVVAFTFNNSTITSTDNVLLTLQNGGTTGAYLAGVYSVSSGACTIFIRNLTAGALAEALTFNFTVIKGATT